MAAATIFDRGLWAAASGTVFDAVAGTTTVAAVDGLAGAAGVKVHTAKIAPSTTVIARPLVKGTMGPGAHLIGKNTAQVDIVFELKAAGSGAFTAGTAPEFTSILQACGASVAATAATNLIIKPDTTTNTLVNKVDICMLFDGMWWRADNCAGTCTVDMTIGNIILVTCTLQGAYIAPVALSGGALTNMNSNLLAVAYDAGGAIVANTTTAAINDGAVIKVAAMGFDMGNDVQEHYVTGDHQFSVANRTPKATFTKDSIGTASEWTALTAATAAALSGVFSTTAGVAAGTGAILTFVAPAAVRETVAYNERAERDILDVAYALYETTTKNDQWSFTFT